ncbi:hypothetical protein FQN54_007281 [Arachnomyces sp. PD_36]|nr:hypothetical protein FQN54_007281 [Arachnomyces sp. PD_36]
MGKKRKTKHRELTQEEIWDDSALIQSWDEAVEEYKLYHSIHARGENVEDVLRQATAGGIEEDDAAYEDDHGAYLTGHNGHPGEEEPEDGEVEEEEYVPADAYSQGASQPHVPKDTSSPAQPRRGADNTGVSATGKAVKEGMNMPQALLEGAKDESLKNLMMAWYYAGYYTGLHEGQQQANQQ